MNKINVLIELNYYIVLLNFHLMDVVCVCVHVICDNIIMYY